MLEEEVLRKEFCKEYFACDYGCVAEDDADYYAKRDYGFDLNEELRSNIQHVRVIVEIMRKFRLNREEARKEYIDMNEEMPVWDYCKMSREAMRELLNAEGGK